MEGTRHEKVVLIIAAYLIGFTTAFIAFGVAKMNAGQPVFVVSEKFTQPLQTEAKVNKLSASVALNEEGLYVVTEEKERIIAANRKALEDEASLGAAVPGYYYNVIDAETSRDGRFAYYCEQLTEDAANCDPYVYSILTDKIHRVKLDGQTFYPIIENHESMWTGNSTLMVNDAVSADEDMPWQLSSVEEVQVQ